MKAATSSPVTLKNMFVCKNHFCEKTKCLCD